MEKLPNFFIIGAPKTGTTALSEYLKEHPKVFFSEPKEPHYFNDDFTSRHTYKEEIYLSYFADITNEHLAIGEGSVFYLFSENAVPNILKKVPDAKFIVMLRDPISLSHSLHSEAIHSHGETVMDFKKAWNLQEDRKNEKDIPKTNTVREALQYAELAKLGEQVERLLQIVDKKNIHFILFDDFKKDTEGEYFKVLEFLNLKKFIPDSFEQINASKGYKNIFFKRMLEMIPYYMHKIGIRHNFKLGILTKLKNMNTTFKKREPISAEFKEELLEYFYKDTSLLSTLLKRDLLQEWGFKK